MGSPTAAMQLNAGETHTVKVEMAGNGVFQGYYIRVSGVEPEDDASSAISPVGGMQQGGTTWWSGMGVITCDAGVSAVTHSFVDDFTETSAVLEYSNAGSLNVEVMVVTSMTAYYYDIFNVDFTLDSSNSPSQAPTISSSDSPSVSPTGKPSSAPTISMAPSLAIQPSYSPTISSSPTITKSDSPSYFPSISNSLSPTIVQSSFPTYVKSSPSAGPTDIIGINYCKQQSTDPLYEGMLPLDENLDFFWNYTEPTSDRFHARLRFKSGKGYVGFGPSRTGSMLTSESVIATASTEPKVMKYYLNSKRSSGINAMPAEKQTLLDVTYERSETETVVSFSKLLQEEGENRIKATGENIFVWAYSLRTEQLSHHDRDGIFVLDLSRCITASTDEVSVLSITENKSSWKAHGIMMFIAWGICTPLAVFVSLSRDCSKSWFRAHLVLNVLSYFATLISFIVAALTVDSEKVEHFNGTHQKAGLFLLVASTLHVVGGFVRPHIDNDDSAKSNVRKYWEWIHKSAGYILICFSIIVISSGLKRYADKYDLDDNLASLYIIFIGFLLFIMLIVKALKIIKQYQQRKPYIEEVSSPL